MAGSCVLFGEVGYISGFEGTEIIKPCVFLHLVTFFSAEWHVLFLHSMLETFGSTTLP